MKSSQFQFDYRQLNVLTGQGSLYIELKDGFDFLLGDDDTAQYKKNNPVSLIPYGETNSTMTGLQQHEIYNKEITFRINQIARTD